MHHVTSIKSQLFYCIPEKKVDFHAHDKQAVCILEGRSDIVHLLGPILSHPGLPHAWNELDELGHSESLERVHLCSL